MESLKIEIPVGHEVDLEKSNLLKGLVFFKQKPVTYDDILDRNQNGVCNLTLPTVCFMGSETMLRSKSLKSLNKLMNIASYLNGNWKPEINGDKYFLQTSNIQGEIVISVKKHASVYHSCIYFKTSEDAQKALDILGYTTILEAIFLNR